MAGDSGIINLLVLTAHEGLDEGVVIGDRGEPVPKRYATTIDRPDGTPAHVGISTTALVQEARVRTMTLIRDISDSRVR